ncbi:MAG: menaquinone biosynthetic enzyme MqnA/MqnD family protein [Thermoguttaceae bacterium]
MKNKLRIGTVPFYNALPLTWSLPENLREAGFEVEITEWIPSTMRDGLLSGKLDLALMPVAELANVKIFDTTWANDTGCEFEILGNACVGCRGKVESVLLISRVEIPEIKTLALDVASKSSVSLSRVMLKRFYSLEPKLTPLPLGSKLDTCEADAFVVIGDRALAYKNTGVWKYRYDLGELWLKKTGLPFVFAAWITVKNRFEDSEIRNKLTAAIDTARDIGVKNISRITAEKAKRVELNGSQLLVDTATLERYLANSIRFFLGDEERKGLNMFLEWCHTT